MTRKKVKLAWITNDSTRRASLKKRRLGLLKKVSELTTLCDVNACVIIYSPDEIEPKVWPSHNVVKQQLIWFRSIPELNRQKKMMNQETYLKGKVTKVQEQLTKLERRNKDVEMAHLTHQINQGKRLDELNLSELRGLTWLVEENMKEIKKRIEFLERALFAPTYAPHHPHLPFPPQSHTMNETARIGSGSVDHGRDERTPIEPLLWDQRFIDMMNNNELKSAGCISIRSDMVILYRSFAKSATDDLKLPSHSFGGSSSAAVDMGLPLTSFRPHGAGAGADDMWLPHECRIGGSKFGPFGNEIELGPYLFGGHIRSSFFETELRLPPFKRYGGSSSDAGSDFRLPFNGKTWANNLSP
ncbi:Transcription factor [Theobroma cacao]|nr:Transcription factor [Theobroma cacao]